MMLCTFLAAVSLLNTADTSMRGAFPLLVTPWTFEARLDVPILVKEAAFANKCGVNGIIWPTAVEVADLSEEGEYEAGLDALAELAATPGFKARITATCPGKTSADALKCVRTVNSIMDRHGVKMAILARPPDDAQTQAEIEAHYRALAAIAKCPVIIQTYNGKSPQPDVSLLVALAKEYPDIYGWVKEESPGKDVNKRIAELVAAKPTIHGVFSGWGLKAWLYQRRVLGTEGMITQRAGYSDVLARLWRLSEDDINDPAINETYSRLLLAYNLGDTFSGSDDEMRGPHLYVLMKRGVFTNTYTRVRNSDKSPGAKKWRVKEYEFAPGEKAEIDRRLAYIVGAAPLKVGLYADKGCRGAGAAWWAQILDGSPDAELTLLSGEDLRNGGLEGLDLFVSPGGAGGPQTAAMGEEGMAAVRKYVANGGKYLGTCCGFSNLLNEQPSFAKRNTMVPFARTPGGPRGGFTGAVSFTEEGRAMLGVEDRDYFIRYHNGPIVYKTEPVPPCSNVVVLATMNSELSERGPVTDPMFGTPAVISCDYAKGRMILFNCHPEVRANTRPLICASIRALTGVDFRLPPMTSPMGRERVGFVASEMTKDVQKAFLELVHDPAVFVVPVTKDDLLAGQGEVFDRLVEK